ncbi:cytidylyltransferase domain-containing protein [Rheinheimera hassiensis]|uniref:acylneuraminate cytidylyltransferase family protein n=1 Tax=Rheinheimera hassiensis TaxID=1193627 RepID=UPI001F0692BE|nr:acylneuraminate cytidylyltransferase family protein [Rheinheimera hassiensis]
MISNQKVVAVIPARAGSKSIPDKNIRNLAGKPLIAWSIDVAQRSKYIDRVIVSTDGDKIAEVSREFGAEVLSRPSELAQDSSLVIDSIRHVIATLRQEGDASVVLVLLEPTSPLREPDDVDNVIEQLVMKSYDSVATFRQAELNPHRAWKIIDGQVCTFIQGAIPWLPRQQQPEAWQLNGAVYAFIIDKLPSDGVSILFGKIGSVIMPEERSLDIDNNIQFEIASALLKDRAL